MCCRFVILFRPDVAAENPHDTARMTKPINRLMQMYGDVAHLQCELPQTLRPLLYDQ